MTWMLVPLIGGWLLTGIALVVLWLNSQRRLMAVRESWVELLKSERLSRERLEAEMLGRFEALDQPDIGHELLEHLKIQQASNERIIQSQTEVIDKVLNPTAPDLSSEEVNPAAEFRDWIDEVPEPGPDWSEQFIPDQDGREDFARPSGPPGEADI